jgi:predicted ABC-type ATPase
LGLSSPGVSEQRVLARTKEGGHYVDPDTILANFTGNPEKLDKYHEMFDSVQVLDTTEVEHQLLVVFEENAPVFARSSSLLPEWFRQYLPVMYSPIKDTEG